MSVKTYRFGFGQAEGDPSAKSLLGGKGANLAGMAKLGLPVPPGITLPTTHTFDFASVLGELTSAVLEHWEAMEATLGRPILLSARSGAPVSMPGMMDTILNLGITPGNLKVWEDLLGVRVARDCYRRFLSMYGTVVLGIPAERFEARLGGIRKGAGVVVDSDLSESDLAKLLLAFGEVYDAHAEELPTETKAIVSACIAAVYNSWFTPRAIAYRKAYGISDALGTAVNFQTMVFGNRNDASATGVLFTRNPTTGVNELTGEFLVNAQGEDVVAGIRTPLPIEKLGVATGKLAAAAAKLEKHYGDMQDIEFTIENGELFILQTRTGKRSPVAAFRIARDLMVEKRVSRKGMFGLIPKSALRKLEVTVVSESGPASWTGIPCSAGAALGEVVTSAADAVSAKAAGKSVILVRPDTSPDDLEGMRASVAVVTMTGGYTSHAAVVARELGIPCVSGCDAAVHFAPGETLVVDGSTGSIWQDDAVSKVVLVKAAEDPAVVEVLKVAREEFGWVPCSDTLRPGPCHVKLAERVFKGETLEAREILVEASKRKDPKEVLIDFTWMEWGTWGESFLGALGVTPEGWNRRQVAKMKNFLVEASADGLLDSLRVLVPDVKSLTKHVPNRVRRAVKVEDLFGTAGVLVDETFVRDVLGSHKVLEILDSATPEGIHVVREGVMVKHELYKVLKEG